jgi:hypothetical protein
MIENVKAIWVWAVYERWFYSSGGTMGLGGVIKIQKFPA